MEKNKNCDDILSLVKTINDNPDMLHGDYTPSVHLLSECGLPAIEAILPLLNSEDRTSRLRAQRVLEGVIKRVHNWQPGIGYPSQSDGENKTNSIMISNGNYQADATEESRKISIEKWQRWLSENLRKT